MGLLGAIGKVFKGKKAGQFDAMRKSSQAVQPGLLRRGVTGAAKGAGLATVGIAAGVAREAVDALGFFSLGQQLPSYFHSITIHVQGGPGADIRRCWFLACAACFGRYRRGIHGVSGKTISANWDITGKSVDITLAYTFSSVDVVLALTNTKLTPTSANLPEVQGNTGLDMLQQGPDQITIGSGWPKTFWTTRQNQAEKVATPPPSLVDFISNGSKRIYDSRPPNSSTVNTNAFGAVLGGATQGISPTRTPFLYEYQDWMDAALVSTTAAEVFNPLTYVPNPLREYPYTQTNGPFSSVIQASVVSLATRALAPAEQRQQHTVTQYGNTRAGVPILPDEGRIITSGEKYDPRMQPPRPPVDGLMKGSILAMISASLSNPGYLASVPPINGGAAPIASEGLYVWPPGGNTVEIDKRLTEAAARGTLTGYSGRDTRDTRVSTENIRPNASDGL